MMNLYNQYPVVAWILIGFGILYLLDKFGIFSPIDNLLNRRGRYKFTSQSHLDDPKIIKVVEYFDQKDFKNIETVLNQMNASQRSFTFASLGQYGDMKTSDEWINQSPQNDLPKVIKGYQLIHKAWEIRGSGTIDNVSNEKIASFKRHLKQAEEALSTVQPNNPYKANAVSCLLTIYKAIDCDREHGRQLFNDVVKSAPDDAELHKSYMAFVSPKWGATVQEYEDYLNQMGNWSPFIQQMLLAQYYFDLNYFNDYQDPDGKVKELMKDVKATQYEPTNLHRYELYKVLYWTASNLELNDFKSYFKEKAKPYLQD